jgi:TetR/AcrR family transcriptional regulator, transcriptional repressor for nem operon
MKRASQTKEKLLQVGFDLIWDRSYGSVSVDEICKRAGINKGSFYHFFPSKADLVAAAYEEHWKEKLPEMERIFSPQVPPLERIQHFCQYVYDTQKEKAEAYGHVCGSPYASVGSEIATFDEKIRARSERLMNAARKYAESTIADAIREGSVTVKDAVAAAQWINTMVLGLMLEARVQNDLKPLEGMESTVMEYLGAK